MATPRGGHAPRDPAQASRRPPAFTLIELLVVISVIVLLAALAMPALMRGMALSDRTRCANNMSQILRGCFVYANQYARHLPTGRPKRSGYGDDDLSRLYLGSYVQNIKAFACPATEDKPKDEKDLRHKATEGGKMSYEYWGEYNPLLGIPRANTTLLTVLMDEDGYNVNGLVDGDNHGTAGGHMTFMDSHVRWLDPRAWLEARIQAGKEWKRVRH